MKLKSKISMLMVGAMALFACNGPEKLIVNPNDVQAAVITEHPTENVVLDRSTPDATQVIVKWDAASFGYKAAITYTLVAEIEKEGEKVRAEVAQTTKLEAALVNKTFNAALVKQLGATPDEELKFNLILVSSIGAEQYDAKYIVEMSVTPYSVDPVPFYVIGQYCDWNFDKAVKLLSEQANGIYIGWVPMYQGGETGTTTNFKFAPEPKWDLAYGGTLEALSTSGGDISAEKGSTNYFTLDIPNLKATIDKSFVKLGMIGNACPGDWATDNDLAFDQATMTYRAVLQMKAGLFKLRCDAKWDNQWGAGDEPGQLKVGGSDYNFALADGTYTVVVDLFKFIPTIEFIAE